MVFLILSMLAGTGAGIVYPAPEANGMPPLIPINHDVCLSATSRRPLSHGAHYHIYRIFVMVAMQPGCSSLLLVQR